MNFFTRFRKNRRIYFSSSWKFTKSGNFTRKKDYIRTLERNREVYQQTEELDKPTLNDLQQTEETNWPILNNLQQASIEITITAITKSSKTTTQSEPCTCNFQFPDLL